MRGNLCRLMTCLVAFLITCDGAFSSGLAAPTVKLGAGVLEGMRSGSSQTSAAFLGIPYAAPPLGELRWKPPQPVPKWIRPRSAQQFGAACPQLPARWLPFLGWSEDCLYLNVWTPDLSANAKLPVLVYFHGGSNTQGYSQLNQIGPALSPFGLVVVSANYRLGPFGFFAHPALTAESEHRSSGNYGLLDQLQALKWVQENIWRFGGDAGRVTVMGQSAGAVDVCLLMSSPLAKGLFQRAIMESGDCQSVLNKDLRAPIPYNFISGSGEAAGERLAKDLGAPESTNPLSKLRNTPAQEILNAWQQDPQIHFDAIVDGWVIPRQPATIFAEGKQMPIPVLVGSNADEATVFGHNDVKTVGQYQNYLRQDTGKYSLQEFRAYPARSEAEVPGQYLRLQSDFFAYGALSLAQSVTRACQKAYLYYFTYAETGRRALLGAYHGEELNFLSDSFPGDWQPSRGSDRLGEKMRAYWTNFAKTGDPNARGLPRWPAYDEHRREYFELGRRVGVRPVGRQLRALEKIQQRVLRESIRNRLAGQSK